MPSLASVAIGAALAVALGCCALALGRAALLETGWLWAHRDALRFDDLVLVGALGVLASSSGWLVLGVALTLGTRALRCSHTLVGRLARAITPSLVRSLLGGACGTAVLVAPTTVPGALAVPGGTGPAQVGSPQTQDCPGRCRDVLGGLPLPDRPWGARAGRRDTPGEPEWVRVRRGDSLWAIAARHLTARQTVAQHPTVQDPTAPNPEPGHGRHPPSGASPPSHVAIAAAWPRWFDTNRARIGDDPDLIRAGTRLVVPPRFR